MSFSSAVKNELCRLNIEDDILALCELSGMLRLCGSMVISRGTRTLKAQTENAAVARRIFSLAKEISETPSEIRMQDNRLKGNKLYTVIIEDGGMCLSEKIGISDLLLTHSGLPEHRIKTRKTKCAYIRGLFLGGGSVTSPEKMYHLELSASSEQLACDICELINKFGMNAKVSDKKTGYIVYMKEGSRIADFLSLIGAHESRLAMENVLAMKEIKNNVNRAVNCETANMSKTINTALKQMEDIEYISSAVGLSYLSESLAQIARVRLQSPPDTRLADLGAQLKPPIGKSGVVHRLNKISEIAKSLKEKKNEKN